MLLSFFNLTFYSDERLTILYIVLPSPSNHNIACNRHMEVWLCPDGDQSTQACFDSNPAQLISDDLYDGPVDANYPERAYFSLDYVFKFTYKLPDGLVGDNVLIQWHYV